MMRPLLPLLLVLPLLGQAPKFEAGKLSDLSCRVASAVALPGSVLCEVEVRNEGALTAEPTVFDVSAAKGQELHHIARCPLPHAARVGHGVARKGLQRYFLLIRSAADPKSVKVEIAKATFYDLPPESESPVTVGALRQDRVRDGELQVDATFARLKNRSNLPVDVILRGSFERPFQGKGLLVARLPANTETEVGFHTAPTSLGWDAMVGGTFGVRVVQLEVVDWTSVAPGVLDAADATAPLLAAYSRWRRWTEPWPSGEGTFSASYQRSSRLDGAVTAITGRFRIKDIAPPLLEFDGNLDQDARQAMEAAFEAAFADLRRPSAQELAARNQFALQDRGRYRVSGPGWPLQFGQLVEVQDGAIVSLAHAESPEAIRQQWLLQPSGDGYLVVGRDTFQDALGKEPSALERIGYAWQGRWIVPVRYQKETAFGGFRETIAMTLAIGDLQQRGQPAAAGPVGPGVEALRQAWSNGYVYPTAAATLRTRIEVATPATDLVWGGERRIKGSFVLEDFRGFRLDAHGLPPRQLSLEGGNKMTAAHRDRLAAAIGDRLVLWAIRDFAGRPPFEAAFRGATVLADQQRPGVFAIGNSGYEEVEVQAGLVVRLRLVGGCERRIEWKKLVDAMVPVKITSGAEVLTATWKRLDPAWSLPVEFRFERVFGKDWGPETIRLSEVGLK